MISYIKSFFEVEYIVIRRKVVVFYGLGGFYYEYKTMKVNEFYYNSQERIMEDWQQPDTLTNGNKNKRREHA